MDSVGEGVDDAIAGLAFIVGGVVLVADGIGCGLVWEMGEEGDGP